MPKTVKVSATLTEQQVQILDYLQGIIGSNRQDVVAKIIFLWLHENGYLKKELGKRFEIQDEQDKKRQSDE